MNKESLKTKAEILLSLHSNGRLLILPNIWDPIGARILEAKGFPAVATASSAVSASLGYEDGEKIKLSTLLYMVGRIAKSVDVPVTADIESGYSETISGLQDTIQQVIDTGIAGINIEDSIIEGSALRTIDEQCERIAAIRNIFAKRDLHLVINARIDSFLSHIYQSWEERIEDVVIRAKAYAEAGADCVYPIGPGDIESIKILRNRIKSPVNILASANSAPLSVLQEIRINRVSFGPFIFRSCMKKFVDIIESLHKMESYDCFGANMMSRAEQNIFLIGEHESD